MDFKNLQKIIYTVGRIETDGSISLLGTCFLVNKKGTFVTAGHVVNNDDRNLVICLPNANIDDYQDTADKSVRYSPVKIEKTDPIHDICVLKGDIDILSNIQIAGTDNTHLSDKLIIAGFPHCLHGRNVLTVQDATVGAKILIDNSGIKSKHIVINIQSRPGQSGSPVFNDSDSTLVAIIIGSYAPSSKGGISLGGIDPQTLHQTTHAISTEYLNNLL